MKQFLERKHVYKMRKRYLLLLFSSLRTDFGSLRMSVFTKMALNRPVNRDRGPRMAR